MEKAQAQLLVNIHEEITKRTFTDIQIICKDGTTTGSRIVLAAMSSYFRAMFSSDMSESQTGVLNLPTVSLSVFEDNQNVFVWNQSKNVVQLSKDELLEIISKEEMECTEDIILKGVMKWIEHNNPEPDDVKVIFENVRLDIVDSQFLIDDVTFSDIVCKNKFVQVMIQKVLRSQCQVSARSRVSTKIRDVFVLHHNKTSLLSRFTSDNKWEDVPPAPVDPGYFYSAAGLDDKIYITGGYNRRKDTLIYDTITKVWTVGPDLKHDHCHHCMSTANSKVYSIGGYYSNTIEELSESETHWQAVGDLGLRRYNTFPVTVGENILVMGGMTDSFGSDVIQCFNTRTHTVRQLNTKLPCSSKLLRGFVHLPDVYLLDNDGHMMHLQVTNTGGEIKIQVKSTPQWKSLNFRFGVTHRNGSLLCFTADAISKLNVAEDKQEQTTFPKSPGNGEVYDVCTMSSGKTS
ncbi:kelch-like protein 25 [Gigantopelta aegis]|uniref:kelch-like protein 25 n=1 Tax=Gigantopelta aegis TaxID=1735272 RepID=UPI001B88C606|nr:kelch-like protein 25 [Gigantopelta aegis]